MPRTNMPWRLSKRGFRCRVGEGQGSLPKGTPIEIWFQDEARVGQKNKITPGWARRGTRPSAPKDQRTKSAYILGATCPEHGKGAGLVLPFCNTEYQDSLIRTRRPKGTNLAMRDPLAWTEKVLLPTLRSKGVDTSDILSMQKALMPLFRDRNANRLATTLSSLQTNTNLHKDERLINKVPGVNTNYNNSLKNDPLMASKALHASFANLETSLGKVLFSSGAVTGINKLAAGLNWMAEAFDKHPNFARGVNALLGIALVSATLKTFGIALKWALSPFRIFGSAWRFLFSAIGKAGPRVPFIKRIAAAFRGLGGVLARMAGGFGRFFLTGFRALGPFFSVGVRALGRFFVSGLGMLFRGAGRLVLRGLITLGPVILRGLSAAFGLLSSPIGWAILAVSVGLLMWRYRAEIAKGWAKVVTWFRTSAWPAVKDTGRALLNWGGGLVASIIRGLSSAWPRLKSWLGEKWRATMPTWLGGAPAVPAAPRGPGLSGKRALGGPVWPGRWLVGERGPEILELAGRGHVIPAGPTARLIASMSHPADAARPVMPVMAPARQRQAASGGGGFHLGHGSDRPL
jgi:hypothetical protein